MIMVSIMCGNLAVICLSHYWGGMENDAVKFSKVISEKQPPLFFICREGTRLHHELDVCERIKAMPISFKRHLDIKLILGILRVIKDQNISNIIFFGTSEIKSIYFARLFSCRDINVIIRYGTTRSSSKKDFLHQFFYSCVSYHVGISEHIVNNIKEIIPISKKAEIKKIHAGTIFTPLEKRIINHDELKNKIILISRIVEGKGHRDLISATLDMNATVTIIGHGEKHYIDELKVGIKASSKTKYYFVGEIPHSQVDSKLQENGIFVFPSYGEGLGNSLVEALGAGLVCIAYDNTVFREFEKMGFYIHLIEDRNIYKLRDKIKEVIDDFYHQWENSQINIKLARELFSIEGEVSMFMNLLK